MPERTPNLHAPNTPFHKEVRNQPERWGRAESNAPSRTTPTGRDVRSTETGITWENGRIAAARQAGAMAGRRGGPHTRCAPGVRHLTRRAGGLRAAAPPGRGYQETSLHGQVVRDPVAVGRDHHVGGLDR